MLIWNKIYRVSWKSPKYFNSSVLVSLCKSEMDLSSTGGAAARASDPCFRFCVVLVAFYTGAGAVASLLSLYTSTAIVTMPQSHFTAQPFCKRNPTCRLKVKSFGNHIQKHTLQWKLKQAFTLSVMLTCAKMFQLEFGSQTYERYQNQNLVALLFTWHTEIHLRFLCY